MFYNTFAVYSVKLHVRKRGFVGNRRHSKRYKGLGLVNRVAAHVLHTRNSVVHVRLNCLTNTLSSYFLLLFYALCVSLKIYYHDSIRMKAHYRSSSLLSWGPRFRGEGPVVGFKFFTNELSHSRTH